MEGPDREKGAAMWEALLAEGLYVNLARPRDARRHDPAHSAGQVGEILGMFERAGRATGVI